MKVYTRFSDKVSFIALVIGVIFCFLVSIGIYSYEFLQTQGFWQDSVKCLAERDFECLLEVRSDMSINKDLMLTLMGANMSILGVIFGFLVVSLFTFKRN